MEKKDDLDLFVNMVNKPRKSCKIIQFPGTHQETEQDKKLSFKEFYDELPDKLWVGIILGIMFMAILIMIF